MKAIEIISCFVIAFMFAFFPVIISNNNNMLKIKSTVKKIDDSLYFKCEKIIDSQYQKSDSAIKADSVFYTNIDALISDTAFNKMNREMEDIDKNDFFASMIKPIIKIVDRLDTMRNNPNSYK